VKTETFAYLSIPLAIFFWFVSFWWRPVNFWIEMSSATFMLLVSSLYFGKGTFNPKLKLSAILSGIASGIALYLVFFAGNYGALLLPSGRSEISSVYSLRITDQPILQGILLVFPIAVGEEVYWRGLIQNQLSRKFGNLGGLLISALLYGGVHLWSRSVLLVVAALLAGLWWGLLFERSRNLVTCIFSHSLWSLLIFVILPPS
jgi:membrane protease YdiL (CAAX protease family)